MTDKPSGIRKGEELNLENLGNYLQEHFPCTSAELSVEQFPGGFSNLTYLVKWGGNEYVLRRPPVGSKVKTAHDMGREFAILSKLSTVWHKAPKVFSHCADEQVLGAPFYLMERVRGVILRGNPPPGMRPDAARMATIADAFVDTFVELHAIDYRAAGLENFGSPVGYVERQIEGWTKRYFQSKTDEVPDIEKAATWLSEGEMRNGENTGVKAGIIHNDFKYDNLVLSPDAFTSSSANVVAVLDWEMATLGDPLMDLGTSLGYWITAADPPFLQNLQLSPTNLPGNPTRSELVHRYALKSGREAGDAIFYYVYGLFKIAVIIQQIYYRYQKGLTRDARFANLIEGVKACGLQAMLAIEKRRLDDLY
jgi:aminoglycoside phosphotransferase (APT) family kinase protein